MEKGKKKVELSTLVIISGVMTIVGFIAGTRKAEFYNLLAPVFGLQSQAGELDLSSVQNVYKTLAEKFDGDLDQAKLVDGASRGLVEAAGDDYTMYMDAEEAEEFNKSLEGDIGAGIGVEVGVRNNLPTVVRVLKNNSAVKAGVLAGDVIVEVNGESTEDLTIEKITSKIKGEAGTTVKIKVLRGQEEKEFSITRATISNPSVELEIRENVAIMAISRFDGETGTLARKYAQQIKNQGISKLVLDLRGNGGGYVTAAQAVASLWLNEKSLIVTEKKGTKVIDEVRATGDNVLADTETIVLADESSASASEIVVGALKDNKKAQIYGVKTYGKGSVQEPIDMKNGALLKVTIAKWYTPSGKNIDKEGIAPDKTVEITAEQINRGEDPQLSEAIKSLK
jgi:carboxyl-terminal processing protease